MIIKIILRNAKLSLWETDVSFSPASPVGCGFKSVMIVVMIVFRHDRILRSMYILRMYP